jgi:phosphatidylserine/phosphatidylglycerophosphate/cardiolipin synthase-like enzyme
MKKRILWIIISFNFIIFPLYQTSHATDLILNKTPTQVYFSPRGGCTEAIISQIDKAKSDIFVQAYSFTSRPIAKALLNAHKQGIKGEAILDKSQRKERYISATFLANSGIPTVIDDRHDLSFP